MMTRSRGRELLTAAAVAVALLAALVGHRRYETARIGMDRLRPASARATIQDRLIGTRLDLRRLGIRDEAAGRAARQSMLLWLVDLERCAGCLDDVNEWSVLEALDTHERVVILMGAPTPDVLARVRAMRRTKTLRLPRDTVFPATGPLLANTKLLLDEDAIVLLADTRMSGQLCGWSFEAQVGALLGLGSADRIRTASR